MTEPAILTWRAARRDPRLGLLEGDVVEWDPHRPKGQRFRIIRPMSWHEGVADRAALVGVLTPVDGTHVDARRALVGQIIRDRGEP